MPGMGHHHSYDPASTEKLGTVHFPVSCMPGQQAAFARGIALLHSFGYTEATEQFQAIAKADPQCAMAHWGIAMAQFHELWYTPNAVAVKLGTEEMASARSLGAGGKLTRREQMYIDALSTFYAQAEAGYQGAADAYAAKMNALHSTYPDDVEAAAFYALSELASVSPTDTSLAHEHRALAVLVPLFKVHPEHPGLAHYIIHTCDTPQLAEQGLEAARLYAKIAPSSPHALHMPAHIFARLGMWPEDIQSNLASVAASERAAAAGEPGAAHQMHANEFLIYAYLQVAEDEKARVLAAKMPLLAAHMAAMPGMDDMKGQGMARRVNEVNAVVPMEMHDWKALVALRPTAGSPPDESFETYWGQAEGAGHLRDAKTTAAALAAFDAAIEALKDTRYASIVEEEKVQRNEVVGWDAYARGDNDAAVNSMRAAADQQDKLGQSEIDIPAREMLGDLLMLLHKPEAALTEYEVALRLSPNRLNGLLSAGEAAEAIKKPHMAAGFYAQAIKITHGAATSKRSELMHAVAYLQQHRNAGAQAE